MPDAVTHAEFDVAILGAGPAGLSAAARAAQRNLKHVVLESAGRHANTIQQYQHRKHVMAEPGLLPLRSDMKFAAGRREEVLERWAQDIPRSGIQIRYDAEVTTISGRLGRFSLELKCGTTLRARNVILALGTQGNARRLGVPGDTLPCVQTLLDDPEAHRGECIVVVGAGDAAIENALALAAHNRVVLVNRRGDFPRAKEANAARVARAIDAGRLECLFGTEVQAVEQTADDALRRYRIVLRSPDGARTIECDRVIARLGAIPPRRFIESLGVRFADEHPEALPEISTRYESNVDGLFIIGALAGSPLIKQSMNQGYEVIEHLCGHAVAPADHAVLEEKLRPLLASGDVESALARIRRTVPTLAGVKPLALRELMLASKVVRVTRGQRICARGDYAAGLFHVLEGLVQMESPSGAPMLLGRGQLFGEISLMSGRPEELAAVAATDALVLETPHGAMKKLMRAEPTARAHVDKIFILRALRLFLLPHARRETVHELAKRAHIHAVAAGETLFEQGAPVDRLYLVRSGSVTLWQRTGDGDVPVGYCGAGSFVDVGGCAAAATQRRVCARATVAVEALSIDHASFSKLLETDAALQSKVRSEQAAELADAARMQAQPHAGDVLSFLMSHGVGEATNVLVIDESLCVGCDQCEKACAGTHEGVSRLNRRAGPSFYQLHLPTSCRHCEHPHCMRDCPPNAIHRLANGEVSIADTCIGCGNCEENCPYGVIQMAEIPPRGGMLRRLLGKPAEQSAKTAVKCDMCADLRAGPACVQACPTGAAIRIHAEDVVDLARQRAAATR